MIAALTQVGKEVGKQRVIPKLWQLTPLKRLSNDLKLRVVNLNTGGTGGVPPVRYGKQVAEVDPNGPSDLSFGIGKKLPVLIGSFVASSLLSIGTRRTSVLDGLGSVFKPVIQTGLDVISGVLAIVAASGVFSFLFDRKENFLSETT